MSAADVRTKVKNVEEALKVGGTNNTMQATTLQAIVEALKEIAGALQALERPANEGR
jgi:hypothetical protein